jgi:hypothetical protein
MPSRACRAEQDLAAFLATLPELENKRLEQGFDAFSGEEMERWTRWKISDPSHDTQSSANDREYQRLLVRLPAQWRGLPGARETGYILAGGGHE